MTVHLTEAYKICTVKAAPRPIIDTGQLTINSKRTFIDI